MTFLKSESELEVVKGKADILLPTFHKRICVNNLLFIENIKQEKRAELFNIWYSAIA